MTLAQAPCRRGSCDVPAACHEAQECQFPPVVQSDAEVTARQLREYVVENTRLMRELLEAERALGDAVRDYVEGVAPMGWEKTGLGERHRGAIERAINRKR